MSHLKNKSSSNNNGESAELLLDNVRKEYEYESDRNKGLQNRAGIFISFIGLILTLFPTVAKVPSVQLKDIITIYQLLVPIFYIILIAIIFIGLIFSLISFVLILSTKEYKRLALKGFNSNTVNISKCKVAENIMIDYTIILKHNISINDTKANHFQRGCISLTICIILIPIFILLGYII